MQGWIVCVVYMWEGEGLGFVALTLVDEVDEVAPLKKAPLWGWGPIHSNVMSLD